MKQEDKQLLLQDLCARLPYGLICDRLDKCYPLVDIDIKRELVYLLRDDNYVPYSILRGDIIKPYLRSLSSMTEEERQEYGLVLCGELSINQFDWLNAHRFDYRGLIEKGLAIAVTKENNPYK
jgi:hypothetical protein